MNPEDFHDPVPTIEHGRFPYLIEGKITNISDDQGLGRVKVKIRGMDDDAETDWLYPAWPGSIEAVPNKGEQVIVQFIEGDSAHGCYWWFPVKNTQGRPTEAMVLGSSLVAMYNDMASKLNSLLSHYQAFYVAVQGHMHASFGTVSASLIPATIDATCKDTSAATGLGKASDGSTVGSKSTSEVVLSGKSRLR